MASQVFDLREILVVDTNQIIRVEWLTALKAARYDEVIVASLRLASFAIGDKRSALVITESLLAIMHGTNLWKNQHQQLPCANETSILTTGNDSSAKTKVSHSILRTS
jgi:DNA-binding NtrC family response regulator